MNKFPFVNLNTGKIYNCKKGSKIWWHERGHIVFDRLEATAKLRLMQTYVFWAWMFATTLSVINKYMLLVSIPAFIVYIWVEGVEEKWCNSFAQKNYKKKGLNIR